MSQQALMICVDNSEAMRNGDYFPSRFENVLEATSVLLKSTLRSNAENNVGLMAMSNCPEVITTLTTDEGHLLLGLNKIPIKGTLSFLTAIQICQLALRHRQTKTQVQRMVVFVGSPVRADREELVRVAKALKKSNVAVDVVSLGDFAANDALLREFVDTANSTENSNCRYISVPTSGNRPLKDHVRELVGVPQSGGGGGASADAAMAGMDEDDPELLAAIQASLQESAAASTGGNAASGSTSSASTAATTTATTTTATAPAAAGAGGMELEFNPDDDPELAYALRMSLMESQQEQQRIAAPAPPVVETSSRAEVESALRDIEGVDLDDPDLQAALRALDEDDAAEASKKKSGGDK